MSLPSLVARVGHEALELLRLQRQQHWAHAGKACCCCGERANAERIHQKAMDSLKLKSEPQEKSTRVAGRSLSCFFRLSLPAFIRFPSSLVASFSLSQPSSIIQTQHTFLSDVCVCLHPIFYSVTQIKRPPLPAVPSPFCSLIELSPLPSPALLPLSLSPSRGLSARSCVMTVHCFLSLTLFRSSLSAAVVATNSSSGGGGGGDGTRHRRSWNHLSVVKRERRGFAEKRRVREGREWKGDRKSERIGKREEKEINVKACNVQLAVLSLSLFLPPFAQRV